jgi:hypothetical protein
LFVVKNSMNRIGFQGRDEMRDAHCESG